MKAIAVGIMAALLAASAQTEEAARRLKVARNAELVDGDLHAAIKQYSAIVVKYVKTDRGVTAMALVHMAECYQKLGDGESHKLYEQVLREYADQKDAAAMARAKLGRTQVVAGTGMSNRRLWTLPLKGDLSGTVSRDGRYVSYVDSGLYGDLFVHDLLTGADRRVTNTGTDGKPGVVRQYAEDSTFSRDGNQLVYTWHRGDDHHELRVVDLKGNGIPQFHRLFDIEDIHWISPDDWSPDGKWLAVRVERKDNTTQIGLVSVQDGSLRVLKSVDGHGSSRMWFSPDGKYLGYDLPESDSSPLLDVFVLAIDGTREIPAVVHRSHDLMTGWSPDGKWLLFTSDRTGSMGLWVSHSPRESPRERPN